MGSGKLVLRMFLRKALGIVFMNKSQLLPNAMGERFARFFGKNCRKISTKGI